MSQQIIEFEKTVKSQVIKTQLPNGSERFRVTQPALLFTPGEKHPDKFDYDLYYGDDLNQANAVHPMPAGRYRFKETAIGTVNSFGRTSLNLDASEIELITQQQKPAAA